MKCTVHYNGTTENPTPNKMTFFEALYFDYKVIEEGNTSKISLFIHPKEKIKLSKVVIEIPFNFQATDKVLGNGFQSWSETRTYGIQDKIPQLRKIVKSYFGYYGDDHLIKNKPNLYSWTYGYVQNGSQFTLLGSTSENTAFSFIEYDINSNLIKLTKLCDDIELSHSFPVLDAVLSKGREEQVFANYFASIPVPNKSLNTTFGWTSWYRHYNKITSEKIEKDLDSFSQHSDVAPFNQLDRVFQIDDGYQKEIGDWLDNNPDFPNGMSSIARKIKDKNLIPGIWIAPFVCSKNSKIYASQKDWLLKDKDNKPIRAGYNPLWGGWYYALDIYNPKVKDYLTEVFFTLTNKWGYQLIKADFLFAACISPPKDRTKAQVMHDAITLLEQLVGQNKMLTCGIPIGSAFHKSSYCRIGPDTHLSWENKLMQFLRKRERVSTINALRTIIHRRHLNKNVFVNDPDVFIFRKDGHKLNDNQQYTILLVQVLFGSQIFNSDDWSSYEEETIDEIKGLMQFVDSQIVSVTESSSDYYQIHFTKGKKYVAHVNLSKQKINVVGLSNPFELAPFESIVLKSR